MYMQLHSFLLCCSVIFCFAGPLSANNLEQLETRFQSGQADVAEILKDIDVYLQRSPNDFHALFLKARVLEKKRHIAESKELYHQIIKARPESVAAYNNLARLYLAQGDLKQARLLLEQGMGTHPAYATLHENLNQVYAAMAQDSYAKALQIKAGPQQFVLTELNALQQPAEPVSKPVKPTVVAENNKQNETPILNTQAVKQPLNTDSETTANITSVSVDKPQANTLPEKQPAKNTATVNKPGVNQAERDRKEIISTLDGWATAWSEQATDVYFIFYADDYHPPGMSRDAWKKQRRKRLKKPEWIKIALKGIKVKYLRDKEATVELVQDYRASNFEDKTRKELRLRQTTEGWRIVAERNIAKIN